MSVLENPLAKLPSDHIPWYKHSYLVKLNYIIISLVLFCKAPAKASAKMTNF